MNTIKIEIYTDGSCRGNGKVESSGGYGIAILFPSMNKCACISKQSKQTTNNREELKAILESFKHIKYLLESHPNQYSITIYSDSAYCVNMINDWIYKWAAKDWKRSKNQSIENLDLVKKIYSYITTIPNFGLWNIQYVKGHNNNFGNELADALATNNMEKINKIKNKNPNIDFIYYL